MTARVEREIEAELQKQGVLSDFPGLGSRKPQRDDLPTAHLEKFYPEPNATDVRALRDYLQEIYRPLHEGHALYGQNRENRREGERYSGLVGLRKLRYGMDETSEKLYRRLSNDVRVRSMQSHDLIAQVRSLLSRNPMDVAIPALNGSGPAIERATKETRWANELASALERRATLSPFQESDDAQCEAFGGWEVFLRDSWDEIDYSAQEGEEDDSGETNKAYEDRIQGEKRVRGLPFGIRALDPLSTLIDPTEDGEGVNSVIIVQKKRAKPVLQKLAETNPEIHERIKAGYYGGSGFDFDPVSGEYECIRYWDPVWYVWMIEGTVIECRKHGLPGVPIFPAWGFVTSSPNFGDKFQGVAYGIQVNEATANDVLTQEVDARLTFNRVKLIATADSNANAAEDDVISLEGPELKMLPPGYAISDAFQGFRSSTVDPSIGLMLGLGSKQGAANVLSGQSPSADASGYSLNLMTQNAIGPYVALVNNKARGWGQAVDFIRQCVKHTIRESVPLPSVGSGADGKRTVEWLEIGPEDITDIPCIVSLDPTSDLEKIALSKWLQEGVLSQDVPHRILQEKGYGATDAMAWNDEITRELAVRMHRDQVIALAANELAQEVAASQQPPPGTTPQIFGPNGQPLPPSGAGGNPTGMPQPAQPSTIGRENVGPNGTAGQMPTSEPTRQAQQFAGAPQ